MLLALQQRGWIAFKILGLLSPKRKENTIYWVWMSEESYSKSTSNSGKYPGIGFKNKTSSPKKLLVQGEEEEFRTSRFKIPPRNKNKRDSFSGCSTAVFPSQRELGFLQTTSWMGNLLKDQICSYLKVYSFNPNFQEHLTLYVKYVALARWFLL